MDSSSSPSSSSSSSSSSASSSPEHNTASWTAPAERPAGRTKFRETRHPLYRGVRHRGSAGRWVCEVRVPGKRGARLWLGTYATAEAAARANDAAMLALGGRSATACLNFADSAWLFAVPCALSELADVRRAVLEAVADFQRREAASGPLSPDAEEPACSDSSSPACLNFAVVVGPAPNAEVQSDVTTTKTSGESRVYVQEQANNDQLAQIVLSLNSRSST